MSIPSETETFSSRIELISASSERVIDASLAVLNAKDSSSSKEKLPGRLSSGASLTDKTVRAKVSVSLKGLLFVSESPLSVVVNVREAVPNSFSGNWKDMPSRAVLMRSGLPLKTIKESAVPSPVVKANPVVVERVSVPEVTWSDTVRLPSALSSSGSLTVSALLLIEEKNRGTSSSTIWSPGTILEGLLLFSKTEISREVIVSWASPAPVSPLSLTRSWSWSLPLKSVLGI